MRAEVDLRSTKRRLAWDMIDHGQMPDPEYQRVLGLSPASADVSEMEHDEADRRLVHVAPIINEIRLLSNLGTTIAQRAILNLHGEEDSAGCEDCASGIETVSTALVTAVIAELLDCGYIRLS